jgi:Ase1/PRC1/MAP65 family protein
MQLQDLGSTLVELWNLMDTPINEQRCFDHVTSLIKVSPNIVMPQGCLAHDLIDKVTISHPLFYSFVCSFMPMLT